MHRLAKLRRDEQERRARFKGEALIRPIFTVQARKGVTASDLEALESIAVPIHNADGSFVNLPGYDDLDDLIVAP